MTVFLVSLAVAFGISFICSLMEAVLLSLTPSQVARLTERHPRAGGIWRAFKSRIDRPIAVILILNTTAHTIGASIAGAQFDELYGHKWLWAFSIGFTLVMLSFSEILPKTLGVQLNTVLAPIIARPLQLAVTLFSPLIVALHWVNRLCTAWLPRAREKPSTVDEIASLAAMARMSQDIGAHQERVILGAARLSDRTVRDLMIPLDQVVMMSDDLSLPRAIVAAHLDAHTRFPVHAAGDRTRVVGYINFKEMIYFMSTNPKDPTLRGITRPVTFVDASASATDLMRLFVDQHEHIAIVRGEDGRALGLVTLEDLVEELIGEVQDEFDRLPRYSHALSGGTWLFGGGVTLAEVKSAVGDVLASGLPGSPRQFADYLSDELGGSPRGGQTLERGGLSILVKRVRRGRVFEASVSPLAKPLS
jgi:CBS domain containing-hemolysin-like protein